MPATQGNGAHCEFVLELQTVKHAVKRSGMSARAIQALTVALPLMEVEQA